MEPGRENILSMLGRLNSEKMAFEMKIEAGEGTNHIENQGKEHWAEAPEGSWCQQSGQGRPTLAQILCIGPLIFHNLKESWHM